MVCSISYHFRKARDEIPELDEKYCTTKGTAMVANDRHELQVVQSDFFKPFDVVRL